ncbi:hypothetical protein KJ673_04390 [Patescibacteria group bacterium]|nr:hypothetical protein [Patescibacteria group bacterium]MBU4453036.1 hypothetical protein [Patescibacteria group bacterium]MCG2687516.1 hypothetical protein [Candidatus Parcubacteria bacterium]
MISREPINLYRCYIGMPNPGAGTGPYDATITNDTGSPVRITVQGNQISFWKPQQVLLQGAQDGRTTVGMRPLPDRAVVNNGGADQESTVLNPGEVCNMTLPYTTVVSGMAQWLAILEQVMPVNPFGAYVPVGVEGRVYSTQFRTTLMVQDTWRLSPYGARHLDLNLSSQFGKK